MAGNIGLILARQQDIRVFKARIMGKKMAQDTMLENMSEGLIVDFDDVQQLRLLKGVLQAISDPLYVIDVQTYRIVLANQAAQALGIGQAQTCYALTHRRDSPCDGREHPCPLQIVREKQQPAVVEHIHFDQHGRPRNMEVRAFPLYDGDGRLTHMVEYSLDITTRRRAEETVRKMSRVVEQTPVAVVITDAKARIEYVNPYFTSLTGYTMEEAIGKNPRILKSGVHPPELYKELWQTISSGRIWRGEWCNRKKNGELYWEEATFAPVLDEWDKVTHYVKVSEDITARKQDQETLSRYMAELETRNAELDAFAHTVAHDLKTPINVIVGYSEVMRSRGEDFTPVQREQFLEKIVWNGRKMNDIINSLLLLATIRSQDDVTLYPLEMGRIVTSVLERLNRLIVEKQARIATSETWPLALGYGPWVEEIWMNYLSNALKYGGTPPEIEMGATPLADGRVRFWVRDNGQGLAFDAQQRIFLPFERLHQVHIEGYGLGLSIVKRIADRLGGAVGVESEPGQGSTFYLDLPGV